MKQLGIVLLSLVCIGYGVYHQHPTPVYFKIPAGWPSPKYNFKNNPLTKEGIHLGRHLFYDPILSRDHTISCASCHVQATGFTHVDHALSHGIDSKTGNRNAMAIINMAWNSAFMWDGAINHLDAQTIAPITHPAEMDNSLDSLLHRLKQSKKYNILFAEAFPDKPITSALVFKAISQFVLSLVSANAKYDQFKRGEYQLTASEAKGYTLFKQHCASCHKEPLFTSDTYENNGLAVDPDLRDSGRMKITQDKKDSLRFRVPTLRNVQFTFPYMHDGRFSSLNEVILHYNQGIVKHRTLSDALRKPMQLTDNQRVDLISFLRTLTDQSFLQNTAWGYPKNK